MNIQELAIFLYEEEQRLWVEFMDKKIANWIYIQDWDWIRQLLDINEFRETYINKSKILWHLWISSILKYVRQFKDYDFTLSDSWDSILIERVRWCMEWIWALPNKELHLYTEQELKDLLDLLHKLKEWKT